MRATFVERKVLTTSITSFSFQPEHPFTYTPGQFIELTLLGHHEDGKLARRWFTLSSAPQEDLLTITTRVGSTAHSPFKRALNKLKPGDEVKISEPLGDFVLPRLLQTPLVFVAGGIGITPYRSMLEWLSYTEEKRPIRMLHSVRTEDDIIFQETFQTAHQHVTVVVGEPSAAWGGERGELNAELILGLEKPDQDSLIYLSGPEPFVRRIERDLIAHGFSRQQIVLDEFQGYTDI